MTSFAEGTRVIYQGPSNDPQGRFPGRKGTVYDSGSSTIAVRWDRIIGSQVTNSYVDPSELVAQDPMDAARDLVSLYQSQDSAHRPAVPQVAQALAQAARRIPQSELAMLVQQFAQAAFKYGIQTCHPSS